MTAKDTLINNFALRVHGMQTVLSLNTDGHFTERVDAL
jgi:hypothetical protein